MRFRLLYLMFVRLCGCEEVRHVRAAQPRPSSDHPEF
jgi:hypothetical protein